MQAIAAENIGDQNRRVAAMGAAIPAAAKCQRRVKPLLCMTIHIGTATTKPIDQIKKAQKYPTTKTKRANPVPRLKLSKAANALISIEPTAAPAMMAGTALLETNGVGASWVKMKFLN